MRNVDAIPFSASDHHLIILFLRAKAGSVAHNYVHVRNYSKLDLDKVGDKLTVEFWNDILPFDNIDDNVECFSTCMKLLLDLLVPQF